MVAMKQRIKSLLLMEGLEFPPAPPGSQWSFLVKAKLRKLPCSSVVRFKLDQLLDNLEFGEKQILRTTVKFAGFGTTTRNLFRLLTNSNRFPGLAGTWPTRRWAGIGTGGRTKNIV